MKMHPDDIHTLDAMAPEDRPSVVELTETPIFQVIRFEPRMPCYYVLDVFGQEIHIHEMDMYENREPGTPVRPQDAMHRIALRKRFPSIRFTIGEEYPPPAVEGSDSCAP